MKRYIECENTKDARAKLEAATLLGFPARFVADGIWSAHSYDGFRVDLVDAKLPDKRSRMKKVAVSKNGSYVWAIPKKGAKLYLLINDE